MTKPTVRFNLYMPEKLHTRFKVACVVVGCSMSSVISSLVREWLKHPIPPPDPAEFDAAARLQKLLDRNK